MPEKSENFESELKPDATNAFTLIYDGPELDTGSMGVAEIAPALLALNDLLDEAGLVGSDGPADLQLSVRSGFRRGSFIVDFLLSHDTWREAVGLFSGAHATAIANILAIVGIPGGFGLFQLIKKLKGRKPSRVIQVTETRTVRIEIDGEESLEVPESVWNLFGRTRAREAAYRIVRPLRRRGIETVDVQVDGRRENVADKNSLPFFEPGPSEVSENSSDERRILQLVSVSFRNGNKWRVSDGTRTMFVSLEDQPFLDRVERGDETFGSNDFLDVTLRVRQRIEASELRSEYAIVKVHKHSASAEQLMFPLDRE